MILNWLIDYQLTSDGVHGVEKEVALPDDFDLSASQRAAWKDTWTDRQHGTWAKVARALSKASGGSEASWKTRLTRFHQGDESGLGAILSDAKRTRTVESALSLSTGDLRARLDRVLGIVASAGPLDEEVPGFEDAGARPILEVFFPPPQRETRFRVGAQERHHGSAGGIVDVDAILEYLADVEDRAVMVCILGPSGSGKGPLLKALCARIAADGVPASPWAPGTELDKRCVWVNRIDLMDADQRQDLAHRLESARCVLVCAADEPETLAGLPPDRVIVSLREGDVYWAIRYLDHLEGYLRGGFRPRVDFSTLRSWLQDDPYAAVLGGSADMVGLLARHVADGGKVPLRHRDIILLSTTRAAQALRRAGEEASAAVMESVGANFLSAIARRACLQGTTAVPIKDAAIDLVSVAGGLAGDLRGPWAVYAGAGMLAVLETWIRVRFLNRVGGAVQPSHEPVLASALGFALADCSDQDLVARAALSPTWHMGLATAAELTTAGTVTQALMGLPPAVRTQVAPALTRVLSSNARAGDPTDVNHAFRHALRWWASRRAEPRQTTITLGDSGPPGPPRIPEALVAGLAPLVAMSIASQRHRAILLRMNGADLAAVPLSDADRAYLSLVGGHDDCTPEELLAALGVGAPYQCDALWDDTFWALLPSEDNLGPTFVGGLTDEEYAHWWRTIAIPCLKQRRGWQARVAGTQPGSDITASLLQRHVGVSVWIEALKDRLNARDVGAPDALSKAFVFTLRRGADANFEGLRQLWTELSASVRGPLKEVIGSALPRAPEVWLIYPPYLTWMLKEILPPSVREELWELWARPGHERVHHTPWRAFLDAGVSDHAIATWAITTLPAEYRVEGRHVDRVTKGKHGTFMQLSNVEGSPQAKALDHLAEHSRDERALTALCRHQGEWAEKAFARLRAEHAEWVRSRTLRGAVPLPSKQRLEMLKDFVPRHGEAEIWLGLAQSASVAAEVPVRWVQAAHAASDVDPRWSWARRALRLCEIALAVGPTAPGPSALLAGIRADEDVVDLHKESARLSAELGGRVGEVLSVIGQLLAVAHEAGAAGLPELVHDAFSSPSIRPSLAESAHTAWWYLAASTHPTEAVVDILVRGHGDLPDGLATLRRMNMLVDMGGVDLFVLPFVLHPVIGRIATRVLARRVANPAIQVLVDALEGQPIEGSDGSIDEATVELASRVAAVRPRDLVTWLERVLTKAAAQLALAWTARIIPVVPPGGERARLLEYWLRVSST